MSSSGARPAPAGAQAHAASAAAQIQGKYAPLARLATGGMAEILLARLEGAQGFEKLVVLKRLLPHLAQEQRHVSMFLDEARTVARISHPNVCQVYELGEEQGRYIIVMEYLEGVTVGRVAATLPPQKGAFELRLCAELIRQACEGLHHAHELRALDGTPAGLVHRDISPQNLLVTVDGVVKVLDFGIAKTSWSTTPTRAGTVIGKIAYMSPEQVRGQRLDRKSDLFSLGVVVHELLVGSRLFRRATDFLTYRAITEKDAPDVRELQPDLPAALAEVVRATLARDPAARPATARELGERIVAAVAPLGGPLRSSEVADWMATQFGPAMQERREFVAEAVRRRARAAERAAGRDDGGFDELPTMQIDAELEPPHWVPDDEGGAGDSDVFDPEALAASAAADDDADASIETFVAPPAGAGVTRTLRAPSASMRVRAAGSTPVPTRAAGAVVAPAPTPVRVEAAVAAPARSGRAWLRWLGLAVIAAAGAAVPLAWKYADDSRRPIVVGPAGPTAMQPAPALPAPALPAPAQPAIAQATSAQPAPAQPTPMQPAPAQPPAAQPAPAQPPPAIVVTPILPDAGNDADDAGASGPAPAAAPARRSHPSTATHVRDARPGSLTIDSNPYATIYIDGRKVGVTPLLRLPLSPGRYHVRAVTADGREQRFRVTIDAGREAPRRGLVW